MIPLAWFLKKILTNHYCIHFPSHYGSRPTSTTKDLGWNYMAQIGTNKGLL